MTESELIGRKTPFKVRLIGRKRVITVIGFTATDPLDEGSFGIVPPLPTVYFKEGGWLLVSDLLKHYEIVETTP